MSNVPIKCYVPIKVGFKNFDVSWLTVPRLTSIFHLSSPKRKIENSKIGSSLICLNDSIVGLIRDISNAHAPVWFRGFLFPMFSYDTAVSLHNVR